MSILIRLAHGWDSYHIVVNCVGKLCFSGPALLISSMSVCFLWPCISYVCEHLLLAFVSIRKPRTCFNSSGTETDPEVDCCNCRVSCP